MKQLKEDHNTYIHIRTLEQYNTLMDIYEMEGWVWVGRMKPREFKCVFIEGTDIGISLSNYFIYSEMNYLIDNRLSKIVRFEDFIEYYNGLEALTWRETNVPLELGMVDLDI